MTLMRKRGTTKQISGRYPQQNMTSDKFSKILYRNFTDCSKNFEFIFLKYM